jgi:ribosomal protein S12 methylthiotransferase accessory factor
MAALDPSLTECAPSAIGTTGFWQTIQDDTGEPRYWFGTHRATSPAVTLRRIKPLLQRAGITRLADVTGLDWIGLPVYQAIRPNSRNLSVSQGKGLTRDQAKVSALMESLETFHAERIAQPSLWATIGALRDDLAYDPYRLELSTPSYLTDETPLEWVAATDLWTGAPSWVPRRLCELDISAVERCYVPLFLSTSNGLASGNTVVEALIHGLCEVIERDCLWRCAQSRFDPDRSVALESIYPRMAQRVLDRFAQAGLQTYIGDLSGPTGLPCFEVWLDHPDAPTLYGGTGCHPTRLTALIRALTEAAQSRATYIAGSRDHITRDAYRRPRPPAGSQPQRPFPAESRRSFGESPSMSATTSREQLREIVRRVRDVTGMSPVAVDLSRPDFDLPVVFVIAPGLRLGDWSLS